MILLEYSATLARLQSGTLKSPSYCSKLCESRPLCYTDFEPNYNPDKKLDKVLLEPEFTVDNMWNRVQFKKDVPGLGNEKFGWLDRRPLYESTGVNSTIYVKLSVNKISYSIFLIAVWCLWTVGSDPTVGFDLRISCERIAAPRYLFPWSKCHHISRWLRAYYFVT